MFGKNLCLSYLKKSGVLDQVFCHNPMLEQHSLCFNAVVVLMQLRFELVAPMYKLEYNVTYDF